MEWAIIFLSPSYHVGNLQGLLLQLVNARQVIEGNYATYLHPTFILWTALYFLRVDRQANETQCLIANFEDFVRQKIPSPDFVRHEILDGHFTIKCCILFNVHHRKNRGTVHSLMLYPPAPTSSPLGCMPTSFSFALSSNITFFHFSSRLGP